MWELPAGLIFNDMMKKKLNMWNTFLLNISRAHCYIMREKVLNFSMQITTQAQMKKSLGIFWGICLPASHAMFPCEICLAYVLVQFPANKNIE